MFSRMDSAWVIENPLPAPEEMASEDVQWNRVLELELVSHPAREHPKITERDYDMRGGVLRLKVRAATAGYLLRNWHVDCSPDHGLEDEAYRLWLRDDLALYGASSALLAPGYTQPKRSSGAAAEKSPAA